MALSHKAKKRWSLVILLIGLPVYVIAATSILPLLIEAPVAVEFAAYAFFGIAWVFPLKFVFRGVGQADPDG